MILDNIQLFAEGNQAIGWGILGVVKLLIIASLFIGLIMAVFGAVGIIRNMKKPGANPGLTKPVVLLVIGLLLFGVRASVIIEAYNKDVSTYNAETERNKQVLKAQTFTVFRSTEPRENNHISVGQYGVGVSVYSSYELIQYPIPTDAIAKDACDETIGANFTQQNPLRDCKPAVVGKNADGGDIVVINTDSSDPRGYWNAYYFTDYRGTRIGLHKILVFNDEAISILNNLQPIDASKEKFGTPPQKLTNYIFN